jgi:uncharacterized protein
MNVGIDIPEERLAELCRRRGIRKLELFGSVVRDDFGPESDIDVMVEFEPERTPGLAFFEIERELEEILGRKVDLLTRRTVEQSPNYIFRKHALRDVATVYEAD